MMHHGGLGTLQYIEPGTDGELSMEPRATWGVAKDVVDATIKVVWASRTTRQAYGIFAARNHNTFRAPRTKKRKGSPERLDTCVTTVDGPIHTQTTTSYYLVSVETVKGHWHRTGVPHTQQFAGTMLSTKPMHFGTRKGKSLHMEPTARLVEFRITTYAMKGGFDLDDFEPKACDVEVTGTYLGAAFGGPPDGYRNVFA